LNFIRREAGIWVGLFPNRFIIYKEVDRNQFDGSTYDGVIIATGAKPAIPPVKGLKKFYWTEFLSEENLPENETILVIGGGLIGVEIASKLVDKNNHVIIVEMLDEMARGMEMIERKLTMKKLNLRKVETYTNYRVKEIRYDTIIIEGNEEKKLKGVDKIVVAAGMQSYNPLQKELEDKFPVYVIGDARKVGKAQTAIKEAYQTAKDL
jgi:pyruvate/2-oxoglutarate dehydrogenase complex dihydrolipoamide dehydrogenase (E3) component